MREELPFKVVRSNGTDEVLARRQPADRSRRLSRSCAPVPGGFDRATPGEPQEITLTIRLLREPGGLSTFSTVSTPGTQPRKHLASPSSVSKCAVPKTFTALFREPLPTVRTPSSLSMMRFLTGPHFGPDGGGVQTWPNGQKGHVSASPAAAARRRPRAAGRGLDAPRLEAQ
jgi:hypothetical protein